ncbi:hypothetical protein Bbelb_319880 [Branchiostoma belcheri]|nr:hypothetical protein Bbelb_319880 [Branchiostoma belcheri]
MVPPPYLVLPLTVEPSKPRLCHDLRYLNLWMKDCPFKSDSVVELTRYVGRGHFQTKCDDKSGYDHVFITEGSKPLVGFQWEGVWYTSSTIPFGWKGSAFVYQTIGNVVMHRIRALGVPSSLYIDDRHAGQLLVQDREHEGHLEREKEMVKPDREAAEAAVFIMCSVLVSVGIFIGIDKSQLDPVQYLEFLGLGADSILMAFRLPVRKKVSFAELREDILRREQVTVAVVQKRTVPGTSGVDVFTQELGSKNCYVYPPLALISPLLNFLIGEQRHARVVLVVPDVVPRKPWWPILNASAKRSLKSMLERTHRLEGLGATGKRVKICETRECGNPKRVEVRSEVVGGRIVDHSKIDKRLEEILMTQEVTAYDEQGKTKVHVEGCNRDEGNCACPSRLAFKTVDSYVGKLRAIFNDRGRGGEWDERLGIGNPAAEQLSQGTTPRQAKPVFLDKIIKVCKHIVDRIPQEKSAIRVYTLARDQAIFKAAFFSGDRIADLMRTRTAEVFRMQSGSLIMNHVFGKTLRDGRTNTFILEKTEDQESFPVTALERYVSIAKQLSISLEGGFLFRSTSKDGKVLPEQPSSSTIGNAFRRYLQKLGIDEGETLHGCRSGCAISLHMAGASDREVMDHVGWFTGRTASHYMKIAQVMEPGGPTARIASEEVRQAVKTYEENNELRGLKPAFDFS